MLTTNELVYEVNNNLKILINQISLERLPELAITPNNELSRIINFFGYFHVELPEEISEEAKTELLLDKLSEYMTASENKEYLSQLEIMCGNFAIEINNSFSTLSNTIKPLVADLYKDVGLKFERLLKKNNAEHLIDELNTPDTSQLEFLQWNGLSSMVINDENVIDLVTEVCNIKTKELNSSTAKMALVKIIQTNFKELNYNEILESNEEIITEYFEKNYKNISADDAKRYLRISVDKNSYLDFVTRQIKNSFDDMRTTTLNVRKIIFDCNNFLDFYDATKKYLELNLTDSVKDILTSNMESVRISCYIALFYCLHLKRNIFKGKLIISKNVINLPEFKKIEKAGLDLTFVASYLKAYYYNKPIPVLGIDTKTILDSTAKMKDDLEKANSQISMDKNIIFRKCLYDATKNTLLSSFDRICDGLGYDNELSNEIKSSYFTSSIEMLSSGLQEEVGEVENLLYNLIISLFYKNTLTYTIYNLINKNYLLMLADKTEIDPKDVTEYSSKSLIELICSFLSNYIKKEEI